MTPFQFLRLIRRIMKPQAVVRSGSNHLYPIPVDASLRRVKQGLAALESRGTSGPKSELDDEAPIFLCGVGWRVGSTLLQRICCTDPDAMIWGEPLANMGLLTRITEAICIAEPGGWPFSNMWLDQSHIATAKISLHRDFIANLYPQPEYFRTGLQRWIHSWLAQPAHQLGFARWGLKETRLAASDALFLRWLFPRAVFVGIIRDPLAAYLSCQAAGGEFWVEPRTTNPELFAAHWNRLAMSWIDAAGEFPFTMIKFEQLASGHFDADALRRATQLNIDAQRALAVKSGGSSAPRHSLSPKTEAVIRDLAREGMRAYGYS